MQFKKNIGGGDDDDDDEDNDDAGRVRTAGAPEPLSEGTGRVLGPVAFAGVVGMTELVQ